MIRAVLTIARRDIVATVFTRGFLVWLLMPLIGVSVGLFAAALSDGDRDAMMHRPIAIVDAGTTLRPWLEAARDDAEVRAAYAALRDRFRSTRGDQPLPPELAALPEDLPRDRIAALGRPGAIEMLRDRAGLNLGRLSPDLPHDGSPTLIFIPAAGDVDAQVRRLLRTEDGAAAGRFDAVLRLEDDSARLIVAPGRDPDTDVIARLVNDARERQAIAAAGLDARLASIRAVRQPLVIEKPAPKPQVATAGGSDQRARQAIGRTVTAVLFMLIGLLAGGLLSNMVEEKANKVIEVLVASVPIPAIFAGKLVAMLAISLIGVAVWATLVGGTVAWALAHVSAGVLPAPAMGWPTLFALAGTYLVTAYLIYGAIYLGIGSLCSSIREVQSLSLPVTIVQALVLIGVLQAVGEPDGGWAQVMSWFPLSSPYMMAARAATGTGLGVHVAAVLWQLAFAALVIAYASRLFRFGVLNSGPPPSLFRLRRQKSSLS